MKKYTDYCTCFYEPKENKVFFYDEIKESIIGNEKVNDKSEADIVMRIWQDNAPEGVICQILTQSK